MGIWTTCIYNGDKFWILKKDSSSNEYACVQKSPNRTGVGNFKEYFIANNKEEALDIGLEIARKLGLD